MTHIYVKVKKKKKNYAKKKHLYSYVQGKGIVRTSYHQRGCFLRRTHGRPYQRCHGRHNQLTTGSQTQTPEESRPSDPPLQTCHRCFSSRLWIYATLRRRQSLGGLRKLEGWGGGGYGEEHRTKASIFLASTVWQSLEEDIEVKGLILLWWIWACPPPEKRWERLSFAEEGWGLEWKQGE